jgi:hypothetical protein
MNVATMPEPRNPHEQLFAAVPNCHLLPSIDFRRVLRRLNRKLANPFKVCLDCRMPIEPKHDQHPIFASRCGGCGTTRLEALVLRYLRARSDSAARRALDAIEAGPREGRKPSIAAIKRAAARRLAASPSASIGPVPFEK